MEALLIKQLHCCMSYNYEEEKHRHRIEALIWKTAIRKCLSCGGIGAFGFNGEGRVCTWCNGSGQEVRTEMRWPFTMFRSLTERWYKWYINTYQPRW